MPYPRAPIQTPFMARANPIALLAMPFEKLHLLSQPRRCSLVIVLQHLPSIYPSSVTEEHILSHGCSISAVKLAA
jgi:hypothetical protein